MKIPEFIKSMLMAKAGTISSKRVCGVTGWIAGIIVLFYCTYMKIQAPDFVDTVFYTSTALLGVDSITGRIYKDKITNVIGQVNNENNT
jgi:hypothetical protein